MCVWLIFSYLHSPQYVFFFTIYFSSALRLMHSCWQMFKFNTAPSKTDHIHFNMCLHVLRVGLIKYPPYRLWHYSEVKSIRDNTHANKQTHTHTHAHTHTHTHTPAFLTLSHQPLCFLSLLYGDLLRQPEGRSRVEVCVRVCGGGYN